MTLPEAIGLFQTQVSNMDSLWAYSSTATFAVLGFTIVSEKATSSINEIIVIQLGYILFALGNAAAIAASQSITADKPLNAAFGINKIMKHCFMVTLRLV